MGNEIMKQIRDRKSVRQYLDKDIPIEVEKEILEAAIQGPSAGNQQMYTILNIKKQDIKERLSVLCDNQPFIKDASLVLVFCSDYKKWFNLYEYGNCNPRPLGLGDFLLSASDTVIAAQNTVVAAESFGIGSCYIGDILENYEEVKKLLKLPENVVPVTMVVFGYPTEKQLSRVKPARPEIDIIVHNDEYREFQVEELRKLVEHSLTGKVEFEKWIQAFCKRKYNSEFSEEMNRSAEKYIDEFK